MSKKRTCHPHTVGVEPGTPPFYYPDCPRCKAKKATGKVTGNEGPLDMMEMADKGLWRAAGYHGKE